ncbi:hypothetical protein [Geodermatophilus sabuli]|uniref:Uncharacterized protein n=1 Tax=Geodermatophilus sabuli TaxID=1564158 RepID=A0A285ECC9_9ACTN|nr:hypothetical protein [Geodermatophilus sabuli]MBB3084079.1 hypothetical protein [Geodermatophilus sabuli]SNX96647.1 hypothetical protein SAMN06893097_104362 [Geodermatophilus sabuli]
MGTHSGRDLPERDERAPQDGNVRSDFDGERSQGRTWTPEEMEEAQPYPLPELPDEEGPRDRG